MTKIKEFLLDRTPINNWAIISLVLITSYHSIKIVLGWV